MLIETRYIVFLRGAHGKLAAVEISSVILTILNLAAFQGFVVVI